MGLVTIRDEFRAWGRAQWHTPLGLVGLVCLVLAGCAPARPLPPPAAVPAPETLQPVITPQDVQHAEAIGYDEGLAAGKRIQAKLDEAATAKLAQTVPAAAAPSAQPPAEPALPAPASEAILGLPAIKYSPAGPAVPISP